jgi:hypothetical protein
MKITNRRLCREFALPGRCEVCDRWCKKREGHHLLHRTPEISIRVNLISLGSTPLFCCPCHRDVGNGKIPAERVLSIVAIREKCRAEDIREVMAWMRRLVKPTASQVENALEELSPRARLIALKELAEAPTRGRERKPLAARKTVYCPKFRNEVDISPSPTSIRLFNSR